MRRREITSEHTEFKSGWEIRESRNVDILRTENSKREKYQMLKVWECF